MICGAIVGSNGGTISRMDRNAESTKRVSTTNSKATCSEASNLDMDKQGGATDARPRVCGKESCNPVVCQPLYDSDSGSIRRRRQN